MLEILIEGRWVPIEKRVDGDAKEIERKMLVGSQPLVVDALHEYYIKPSKQDPTKNVLYRRELDRARGKL